MLHTNMFSLETFESQISALMETVVDAAVTELSRLLANVNVMAAQQRAAATPEPAMKSEEEESEVTPPEEKHLRNKAITKQFASLMESWTKGAVEKILKMLKVSMCEAEDGPAAEQRAGLNNKTRQTSMKPKAGQVAGPKKPQPESASRSSCQKRKKMEGGPEPAITKENDHIYHRADAATRERNSGSPSEPEAMLTEATSELASDVSAEDGAHDHTDTSTTTSKVNKKKTAGLLKCPSCDKSFALKCMMDRHYLTHSKPHLCPECGKRFARQRQLIAHSRRHTGEKPFECSECGTEFAHKSTFVRHMRQHSVKKPSTHTCTLCENQFTGVLALQRHRCCALKKTFVCSLCPETFECRQSLADHENLHSGDRDFICEMCGESFFSSSSLATHRVTHTQKENCCDVLGLGCSDLSVLKSHLSKHSGEKLFSCEVCGKGCSHKSALQHHMLTHTGEKPYVCETCGKRCGHASALQNHMRIHTGKKPGQQPACDVCGKKFRSSVNLKYHMSIHTGEKPYACDQCDKRFSNPSNLKLHARIHSGEKSYGCNICARRFTQSSSLKLHRRVHTGEKPYWCVVCGKGFIHRGDFKKHQRGHLPDEPRDSGHSEKTAVKI
ncbi:oocyte zinc finger protein XlCOF6-like isoform X2 [Sander lucioperca]|uniref:oocyte zinc finger protein XlCOF6-like isoform X2 n=1 Tax=Sander lucioperca TaxID=283035 RepID=UPI00165356B1|nr:oocyte zinc finger protein XlCOF6-like isoform X2 [Sander lucioperca]